MNEFDFFRTEQMDHDRKRAERKRMERWLNDPVQWVKDHVDVKLANYRSAEAVRLWLPTIPMDRHSWLRQRMGRLKFNSACSYQADALRMMATPGYYAYQWANGTAKTTTAALFVLWFLDTHVGGKVVTTAGTWSQLAQQLWKEIAFWNGRSHGTVVNKAGVNATSISIAADWFAFGRAAKEEETFEGVHGKYVAVIMDEAKAIKPEIFNGVRRILRGNQEGKFWWICLSSPGSPTGPFFDITTGSQSHRWTVSKLSAYQSERVSLDQIDQDAQDLGESSPLFVAMDLGEFPDETEDTVIPISWVQSAVDNQPIADLGSAMGVDVARFGDDETVFMRIDGRKVSLQDSYTGKQLMESVGRIMQYAPTVNKLAVDDAGLGGGVIDRIRELENQRVPRRASNVVGINGGTRAAHPDRFFNLNAEMMWELRKVFEANFRSESMNLIGIPNDPKLIHQLSSRKFQVLSDGRIKIESKSDMRRRGQKSPDRADALMYAWWLKYRGRVNNEDVLKALLDAADPDSIGARIRKMEF